MADGEKLLMATVQECAGQNLNHLVWEGSSGQECPELDHH